MITQRYVHLMNNSCQLLIQFNTTVLSNAKDNPVTYTR